MARTDDRSRQVNPPPVLGRRGPPHMRFADPIEKPKDPRDVLRRLWRYVAAHRSALVAASLIVTVGAGLDLLGPYLMGRVIDKCIIPHNLHALGPTVLLMMAVYVSSAALNWAQSYLMASASLRIVADLRADLFEKLQHLSLPYHDRHAHGDLMSRLTNDIDNISQVFSGSLAQIVSGSLTMVGSVVAMALLSLPMAVVSVVATVVITFIVNFFVARGLRERFREQQGILGELNGYIEEKVTAQRVVKSFHREAASIAEFEAVNQRFRVSATTAQSAAGVIGPLMNMSGNLSLTVIAFAGGLLALQGRVSVGTIAAFINYSNQFRRPLNDIANLYNSIQSALAGAERVLEVIDEEPEIDAAGAEPLAKIDGDVLFDNVRFSYVPGVPVLKNLSLHARPGQTVALVGPTGAGKTTIVNVLTRFHEIESGTILIDGRDLTTIPKESLRRQLAIVLQDTFLFAGTVMDNIRYGRLDATDGEIRQAAILANADQFIHRLPRGYDTELSERGGNLSQGQRQLLSIARAILANPSILILDEATSSVDTRTERHIQEAMLRLRTGRTSFVIAHRLSTIRDADQILLIKAGGIVEHGSHAELLSQRGTYWRMYAGQVEDLDDVVSPPGVGLATGWAFLERDDAVEACGVPKCVCNKLAYCEKDSGRLMPPGHSFTRASFTAVIYVASSTRVRPFAASVRRSRTGFARASFTAVIYVASSTRVRPFVGSVRRSRTGLARASFTAVIHDASSTRVRPFAASVRRSRTGLARASFTAVIYDASSTRVRPIAANDRLRRTWSSSESAVTALFQKRPRRPGSRPFQDRTRSAVNSYRCDRILHKYLRSP
ncbi:MAG: ABC transporter ATP-binding protein [Capsulimonadaceae bacterium]|nr:ABC transporter ATP-binding protein [Capsulimonadaceae bacterium]